MDQQPDAQSTPAAGIGTTALGRIQLRRRLEDGFEETVVERRWADLASARAWCQRTLDRLDSDTTVLEVQVFEESWQHLRSWEARPNRPRFQALQLGVPLTDGTLRWSELRSMTPTPAARRYI